MTAKLLEPPQKHRNDAETDATAAKKPFSPLALKRQQQREKLQTSRFDAVSALLMSLAWFIGTFVLLLFLAWLTTKLIPETQRIGAGPKIEPGRQDNAEGIARDFDPPSADEIVELSDPATLETLVAMTDAASSVVAVQNTGSHPSRGDSRPAGPGDDDVDVVSPHERWELRFSAKNQAQYAQQLDYFHIELGVLGGGMQGVDYAKGLAAKPTIRKGESEGEKRLYFMWIDRASPLYQFDRQLLQKAGINVGQGRELLKFIEPELEAWLAEVELNYAKQNGRAGISEIQKTVFQSRPAGNGYTWIVVDQRYRKPKRK
jgi:hypothetical protein